jgi:hypothetical protein
VTLIYDLRNPNGDTQIGKYVALRHIVTQWKVQRVDSCFVIHVQKFQILQTFVTNVAS